MKSKNILIITGLATAYYILWSLGVDYVWAGILKAGISTITAAFSDIQKVVIDNSGEAPTLYFYYPDRNNHVNMEFALPIVLLFAWQTYLFVNKEATRKFALKSLGINMTFFWLMQIFYPLLLFNISVSKTKATFFFLGLQIFGMIALFLIIKDAVLLKYRTIYYPNEK